MLELPLQTTQIRYDASAVVNDKSVSEWSYSAVKERQSTFISHTHIQVIQFYLDMLDKL